MTNETQKTRQEKQRANELEKNLNLLLDGGFTIVKQYKNILERIRTYSNEQGDGIIVTAENTDGTYYPHDRLEFGYSVKNHREKKVRIASLIPFFAGTWQQVLTLSIPQVKNPKEIRAYYLIADPDIDTISGITERFQNGYSFEYDSEARIFRPAQRGGKKI